jgi:predicted phosphate transport protein (TIGR00153 family)
MKLNFFPRESHFFELFRDQGRIISRAAKLLVEEVRSSNPNSSAMAWEIKELEREGDAIVHELLVKLNQTFLTPIDPEDIHALSSSLDDVLDGIEDAAYRFDAYHIGVAPCSIVGLCDIIEACSGRIEHALEALEKKQSLLEDCVEINRLENEADQLVRDALARLMSEEKDAIELMKTKEVYEFLENTVDRCEDVADVLQNVTVKLS